MESFFFVFFCELNVECFSGELLKTRFSGVVFIFKLSCAVRLPFNVLIAYHLMFGWNSFYNTPKMCNWKNNWRRMPPYCSSGWVDHVNFRWILWLVYAWTLALTWRTVSIAFSLGSKRTSSCSCSSPIRPRELLSSRLGGRQACLASVPGGQAYPSGARASEWSIVIVLCLLFYLVAFMSFDGNRPIQLYCEHFTYHPLREILFSS